MRTNLAVVTCLAATGLSGGILGRESKMAVLHDSGPSDCIMYLYGISQAEYNASGIYHSSCINMLARSSVDTKRGMRTNVKPKAGKEQRDTLVCESGWRKAEYKYFPHSVWKSPDGYAKSMNSSEDEARRMFCEIIFVLMDRIDTAAAQQ